MKMRAPGSESVYIGLTSGHTICIPPATEANPHGIEVPKQFIKLALAEECIPAGMAAEDLQDKNDPGAPATREQVIRAALVSMLDDDDDEVFKADGTPNLNYLAHKVGFKVQREECDKLWPEVKEAERQKAAGK